MGLASCVSERVGWRRETKQAVIRTMLLPPDNFGLVENGICMLVLIVGGDPY